MAATPEAEAGAGAGAKRHIARHDERTATAAARQHRNDIAGDKELFQAKLIRNVTSGNETIATVVTPARQHW
jgi:hypothetical protein